MNKQLFIHHVEGCQRAVRRFLTALCCGDSAVADDLAQDTFVKAYLAYDKLQDSAKFQSWILKIAYNTFINHSKKKTPLEPLTTVTTLRAPNSAEDAFRYGELYEALEQLTPKERSAILLYYMQGYSVAEISDMLSLSVDSVKQRLSRGRVHLKKMIDYGR